MRTSGLGIKSDRMRKRMDASQTHAGAWVHDEALQTAAPLLHATAPRTTYARQHKYNLGIARYAEPSQIMGKISFLSMCGASRAQKLRSSSTARRHKRRAQSWCLDVQPAALLIRAAYHEAL